MSFIPQHPESSVQENLSALLCFVYSRQPLQAMIEKNFHREWKTQNEAVFDIAEEKALKAILELARFLKDLEMEGKTEQAFNGLYRFTCGNLAFGDKPDLALTFPDIEEKIAKAASCEWRFPEVPGDPVFLICHSSEPEKWMRADIDLRALAFVCGNPMSRD